MASLPLLALPYPLLHNVINQLNLIELIEFSFASTQCLQLVQSYARVSHRILEFDVVFAEVSFVRIRVDAVTVMFAVFSSIRDDKSALKFLDAKDVNKPRKVFEKLPFDARKLSSKRIIDFWRQTSDIKGVKHVMLHCYAGNKEELLVEIADYLIKLFKKPPRTFAIKPELVKNLEPLLTSDAFRSSWSKKIVSSSKKKLTSQEMTWILEAPPCVKMELTVTPHRNFEFSGYLRANHLMIHKAAAAWVTPHMIFESFRHCEVIGLANTALVREEHLNQIVKRWLAGYDRLKDFMLIGGLNLFDVQKIDEGLCYFKSVTLKGTRIQIHLVRRADGRIAGVGRSGRCFKFKVVPPRRKEIS